MTLSGGEVALTGEKSDVIDVTEDVLVTGESQDVSVIPRSLL